MPRISLERTENCWATPPIPRRSLYAGFAGAYQKPHYMARVPEWPKGPAGNSGALFGILGR